MLLKMIKNALLDFKNRGVTAKFSCLMSEIDVWRTVRSQISFEWLHKFKNKKLRNANGSSFQVCRDLGKFPSSTFVE